VRLSRSKSAFVDRCPEQDPNQLALNYDGKVGAPPSFFGVLGQTGPSPPLFFLTRWPNGTVTAALAGSFLFSYFLFRHIYVSGANEQSIIDVIGQGGRRELSPKSNQSLVFPVRLEGHDQGEISIFFRDIQAH
jgi:hypothetical protein